MKMKTAYLPLIMVLLLTIVVAGCDSRTVLNALLEPGPEGDTPPEPPAIVTATPAGEQPNIVRPSPEGVVIVTATPSPDAIVDARRTMNMRYGPGTNYGVLAILERGDPLTILGRNIRATSGTNLWFKARTADGVDGWVAGWLLDVQIDAGEVPVVVTPRPPATNTPVPTNTPTGPSYAFWADTTDLANPGDCTTLHWRSENIRAMYLNGQGVAGNDDLVVCPTQTTTYTLDILLLDGRTDQRRITITVHGAPVINFWADRTVINNGECTTVRWAVANIKAVYFQGQGVVGEGSAEVCPTTTTTYELHVVHQNDVSEKRYITVTVQ